jgi:hypothetical protein
MNDRNRFVQRLGVAVDADILIARGLNPGYSHCHGFKPVAMRRATQIRVFFKNTRQ